MPLSCLLRAVYNDRLAWSNKLLIKMLLYTTIISPPFSVNPSMSECAFVIFFMTCLAPFDGRFDHHEKFHDLLARRLTDQGDHDTSSAKVINVAVCM